MSQEGNKNLPRYEVRRGALLAQRGIRAGPAHYEYLSAAARTRGRRWLMGPTEDGYRQNEEEVDEEELSTRLAREDREGKGQAGGDYLEVTQIGSACV